MPKDPYGDNKVSVYLSKDVRASVEAYRAKRNAEEDRETPMNFSAATRALIKLGLKSLPKDDK